MSLEDIQKKIIADAEQKKTELFAEAEKQSALIINKGKALAKEYQEEHEKSARSSAENLERGLVMDARRKLANEKLARKRKRIEQVFVKAKESFLLSSDYASLIKALVLKSITSKKEVVVLGKNEKVINQNWLDDINTASGSALSFSKDNGTFEGGVLLVEGDTFINITVDILFTLLRERTEKPIAGILFKG